MGISVLSSAPTMTGSISTIWDSAEQALTFVTSHEVTMVCFCACVVAIGIRMFKKAKRV